MKKTVISKAKLNSIVFVFLFLLCSKPLHSQETIKLRDLSPDRPHQTESPITVDKWHIMLEADLVNYTRKKIANDQLNTIGLGLPNIKFGFHKRMDIEIISDVYTHETYKNKTSPDASNYFSSFTFRYKLNLIGNDSGDFALAIMPTLKTSNFFVTDMQLISGGFLINIEKELLGDLGLGYTGGLSGFSVEPFMQQYELFSTVSIDYKLIGALRSFVECSYKFNRSAEFTHTYSIDSGVIYTPTKNLQFDTGFYFYLPAKSPFFFIGGTIRI
jgi:hypothetical protein